MLKLINNAGRSRRNQSGWQVMIVDDDHDVLLAMKDLFELEFDHLAISTATNSQDALELTRKLKPDLVILDINLGQTTGLDLVLELRKVVPDLRCIMMTAHRNIEYATTAISRGINEYFLKPINTEQLLDSVEHQIVELEKYRKTNVAEKAFHIIFDHSDHVLMTLDENAQIIDANHTLMKFNGMDKHQLVGLPVWQLPWWGQRQDFRAKILAAVADNRSGYSARFEIPVWDVNQQEHVFLFNLKPVLDESQKLSQVLVDGRDITDQKQNESALKELAYSDPLTDLANRFSFNLYLNELITQSNKNKKVFALLFIDLDNFKDVNDLYGHQAGDDVLAEVACEIKNCLRDDDFIARLGGDEFTVILNEVDRKIINRIACKIVKAVSEIKFGNYYGLNISSSIGIALFPDCGANSTSLMKNADLAMYAAKQAGKNCHRYFSDLEE